MASATLSHNPEAFYSDSSWLETVNYCRKEFHLKFIRAPRSASVYKYYNIYFFFRKTIIGCFRKFKVIFTVYHPHVCSTTNSLDSITARKSATKERRRRNKKSYLFLYQSGWAIWMLLCYKVTRKSFFPRDLFVLTLDECFVTPERLYFSVASSQN